MFGLQNTEIHKNIVLYAIIKKDMKLTVNFGDQLKGAEYSLPRKVPVTMNFDPARLIGNAELKQDGNEVIAELNIVNRKEIDGLQGILECGVCGVATKIEGGLITKFDIKGVSIQFKYTI